MKLRREVLLVAGLLMVLTVFTVGASVFQTKQEQIPALSSSSNQPDGARALRLWLERMHYRVSDQSGASYQIPPESDLVFILEPGFEYTISTAEWRVLKDWVKDGGWLVVASRNTWLNIKGSGLEGISMRTISVPQRQAYPSSPVFRAPPITQPIAINTRSIFQVKRPETAFLLVTEDGPIAVEVPHGNGRIILLSDATFATNQGLREPASAALVLNLLDRLPPGSAIWFDEWHHGQRSTASQRIGPEAWLTETSAGHAILFSAAIIFLWLVLSGRRFGRPVPLPRDLVRRAPLEYVTALANLNRRAGHRKALMHAYRTNLKRAYGQRYRLDASLPDVIYVDRLARYKPDLDSTALLDLLDRLNRDSYSEAQVVQLAHEAAEWMNAVEYETNL